MPATQNATAMTDAASLEALDAILEDLDLDNATEESIEELDLAPETEEEVVLESAPDDAAALDDDELRDLEITLERQETYEAQPAGKDVATDGEAPAAKAATGKKPRAAKPPKDPTKAAAVRIPRDINAVPDEFFVLSGDPSTMDAAALTANKLATLARMPSQKKIAEKFENLFTALSVGKAPSVYTMIAFRALDAKGELTSAEVTGAFRSADLGDGTARSQQGQMMNLFAAVGIADRVGQTLKLRSDSLLAERLRKLPTAAA